jgi:hypothetical protein
VTSAEIEAVRAKVEAKAQPVALALLVYLLQHSESRDHRKVWR